MTRKLSNLFHSFSLNNFKNQQTLLLLILTISIVVFALSGIVQMEIVGALAPFVHLAMLIGGAAAVLMAIAMALLVRSVNLLAQNRDDNEQKYRTLFENASDIVFLLSDAVVIEDCSERVAELFGYQREELIGQTPVFLSPPAQPDGQTSEAAARSHVAAALSGQQQHFFWRHRRNDGSLIDTEVSLKAIDITHRRIVLATVRDITKRRQAEEALRRRTEELTERLIELNCLYSISFILSRRDISIKEISQKIVDAIPTSFQYPEITAARIVLGDQTYANPNFYETKWLMRRVIRNSQQTLGSIEVVYLEERPQMAVGPFLDIERLLVDTIAHLLEDYLERSRNEQALRDSEDRYRAIITSGAIGLALADLDGFIFQTNAALQKFLGYSDAELVGKSAREITHADDRETSASMYAELAQGKRQFYQIEKRYLRKDGTTVWGSLTASLVRKSNGEPMYVVGLIQNISKRKQAEEMVKSRTEELARSNAELEQFAYVASHDLQEPLRMIASYVQLLQRRYTDKLDQDANDFIAYAVEGANRMKALIQALLEYSRVGTRAKDFAITDFSVLLTRVVANLKLSIAETNAIITSEPLPALPADESQMGQLLQNLIENALKFHNSAPPHVRVSAEQQNGEWVFSVSDNGIGVESQYFERIFEIFQRLHPRGRYKGTGVGLAICKKIVERHGGRIWVESQQGAGSKFKFTIPL
jgi:PAS domain S-box-containing protein